MIWTEIDTWITVIAVLSAGACALLGNLLVLRRMSMMGDAISHAVLPGIAIAFMISNSRGSLAMFIGAVLAGLLTAVMTQGFHKLGKVEESASMGIVFTTLFAVGLILINHGAHEVDLDPGCVLYGAIELAPLYTWKMAGWYIPRAAVMVGGVFMINAIVLLVFFKEFKISSFDEGLANSLGFSPQLMHYLLMVLVAVTTVACFESVGSILVIAMLIVPAASASLWTHRLSTMIAVSLAIAFLCAAGGHVAAITVPTWFGFTDTITSGGMSVVAGLVFVVSLMVAPERGLISRALDRFRIFLLTLEEDLLSFYYRWEELDSVFDSRNDQQDVLQAVIGASRGSSWLAHNRLLKAGLIARDEDEFILVNQGVERARKLIQSHRLWEAYLVQHMEIPIDHVHAPAERLEHVTTDDMRRKLVEVVEQTQQDPHGREIPQAD